MVVICCTSTSKRVCFGCWVRREKPLNIRLKAFEDVFMFSLAGRQLEQQMTGCLVPSLVAKQRTMGQHNFPLTMSIWRSSSPRWLLRTGKEMGEAGSLFQCSASTSRCFKMWTPCWLLGWTEAGKKPFQHPRQSVWRCDPPTDFAREKKWRSLSSTDLKLYEDACLYVGRYKEGREESVHVHLNNKPKLV